MCAVKARFGYCACWSGCDLSFLILVWRLLIFSWKTESSGWMFCYSSWTEERRRDVCVCMRAHVHVKCWWWISSKIKILKDFHQKKLYLRQMRLLVIWNVKVWFTKRFRSNSWSRKGDTVPLYLV